jgi:NADH-quinone oxidoreductase subunit G
LNESNYVLIVRELADFSKLIDFNFNELQNSNFNTLFGESTGSEAILGVTGEVMEAAIMNTF